MTNLDTLSINTCVSFIAVDGRDEAMRQRGQSSVLEEQRKKKEPKAIMHMEPKTPSVMSKNDLVPVDELSFEQLPLEQFGGSCDDVVIPCEESLLACGLTAEELADLEMDVFSHGKSTV
jgi:hypothetical protein